MLLVAGATGGVGSLAVQLAARAGATVIAPALPEDEDYLRGLGVTRRAAARRRLAALVRERYPDGVDALLDLVSYAPGSYDAALKAGARVASPTGAAGEGPGRTNVMAAPTRREPPAPRRAARRRDAARPRPGHLRRSRRRPRRSPRWPASTPRASSPSRSAEPASSRAAGPPRLGFASMSESGFVSVQGGRVYYEAEGDGPPVLLIHGGLGTLRMWDEQVPRFGERHSVIRYDTRGFGRTETDDVEFANRDDAIAVLDHLGVASAAVVGQSRGAMIALDLALDRSDRFDALVSVAGGIGGYEPELADGTSRPPWDELERLWSGRSGRRSRSSRPRCGSMGGDSRVTASTRRCAGESTTGSRRTSRPGRPKDARCR